MLYISSTNHFSFVPSSIFLDKQIVSHFSVPWYKQKTKKKEFRLHGDAIWSMVLYKGLCRFTTSLPFLFSTKASLPALLSWWQGAQCTSGSLWPQGSGVSSLWQNVGYGRAISDPSPWVTLSFNICALFLGLEGNQKTSLVSLRKQMAGQS